MAFLQRIGILPFGTRDEPAEAALADALRAAEIDAIFADAPVTTPAAAKEEAARIARADCDAVLLLVAPNTSLPLVGAASLHLVGIPLLVPPWGFPLVHLDAMGVLADLGVGFDRFNWVPGDPLPLDWLRLFLRDNGRVERQRGREAAGKLYGQTCSLYDTGDYVPYYLDVSGWMHQFGIVVTANKDTADFRATHDPLGALTRQLLGLLRQHSTAPVYDLTVRVDEPALPHAQIAATFARITRQRGRYRCLLFTGALYENRFATDCPRASLLEIATFNLVHAIGGEHMGALRAACEALDIEPIILR